MPDYIERNLEPDETVLVRARYHWWFDMRSFWLQNAFNHLLVTDRRILEKSGIFSARTQSLALSQLESKDVEQSIWGRLFGFGDVVIHGSGGKVFRFESLADPTAVSRAIGRAAAQARQSTVATAINTKPKAGKRKPSPEKPRAGRTRT